MENKEQVFELVDKRPEGCAQGYHLWDKENSQITAAGGMTRLSIRCVYCHATKIFDSNLISNIEEFESATQMADTTKRTESPDSPVGNMNEEEILAKLGFGK